MKKIYYYCKIYNALYIGDEKEYSRISKDIFSLNKQLEESLKKLQILDGKLAVNEKNIDEDRLYSKDVNMIVPIIAESNLIRKRILNFINYDLAKREGLYAMTGHNLKEIDTTQLTTIFLDINDEQAAERLYHRNPLSYDSILDALKEVDKTTSSFLAKNCHYLHTPRNDEFFAYGAFIPGQVLPIAWVSFSKQDRDYKKQLLDYIGFEPQNTLEMTRAWCSNYAPQNIMSSLFQHSINAIKKQWKQIKEQGFVNKDIQAITTAINPNLGFTAASFFGCNFVPYALRPARFTYGKKGNTIEYMTRRQIKREGTNFFENRFNILPLNEMILCVDEKKQQNLIEGRIYSMDMKIYDKVLEKEKRDGQDFDSN